MYSIFFYKSYKWLSLLLFLIILDVGIKYWIRTFFFIGEIKSVAPGINFCYLNNSGLAFGVLSNINICYQWIFICFILLIIIMFFVRLYRSINFGLVYDCIAYSMIIGGALGNLYDRILYGSVVDFIDLYIGIWHWPAFNIADIEIFIGMFFLVKQYIVFVHTMR